MEGTAGAKALRWVQCLACLKTGKTATVTRVGKQRGSQEGVRVKWNSNGSLLSLRVELKVRVIC